MTADDAFTAGCEDGSELPADPAGARAAARALKPGKDVTAPGRDEQGTEEEGDHTAA